MSEHIKNHGLNLLLKIAVTIGAGLLIYFTLTSFFLTQSTNLDKIETPYDKEVPQTSNDNNNESTSTPISRDQLAEGLMVMHNSEISIPDSLTLSQYEGIIASTTLTKEEIAVHLVGDASSPEYSKTLDGLNQVGPGFLMRGGQAGLQIYLPYVQNVLDDDLVKEGQPLVRLYLDSLIDKNGKNVLDSESPFEQNNFFNRLKFETAPVFANQTTKYYATERALHLKGNQLSIVDDIKQISGSVVLNLPISVSKYSLSLDQIVTRTNLKMGNAVVGVTDVKDGAIYVHIKSNSKTVVYIKCFNQNGDVIASSMVTGIDPEEFKSNGFDKQAILSFNLTDQVDHLEVYAPSEIVSKKYHFAI